MRLFPSPLRKLLLACDSSMSVAFLNTLSLAIMKANGLFIRVLHSGCKGKCEVGQKFKLILERRKCYIKVLRRWGDTGLFSRNAAACAVYIFQINTKEPTPSFNKKVYDIDSDWHTPA
jgi:hypothetical protein